ncbi:ArfGap-domain-containing protein [Ramaria rubella]|nr:ArfGap-domain-containing protein [Ramaria rubella]
MSRQDKSTSERHTRTLRDLVKRPENKLCADCKRNDPRWASWNLGVFLCIRCSGIHRSMGTHISKVKSVDLDIWTPEQMDSIQVWGNARANLYWEAHLKPGHIPAEHKMESFIRSKYESRRWALEGPPPKDPSVLENAREHSSKTAPPPLPPQSPSHTQAAAPQPAQRQSHTLLSAQTRSKPSAAVQARTVIPPPGLATTASPVPPATSLKDDLFSLDFHGPTVPEVPASSGPSVGGPRDVKNDILSLFASAPPSGNSVLGGSTAFGTAQAQAYGGPLQSTGMVGNSGTGMWGPQSGWNGTQAAQLQPAQSNLWNQQAQQSFGGVAQVPSQNVWGAGASQVGGDLFNSPFSTASPTQAAKKEDAFGDLWGGFK